MSFKKTNNCRTPIRSDFDNIFENKNTRRKILLESVEKENFQPNSKIQKIFKIYEDGFDLSSNNSLMMNDDNPGPVRRISNKSYSARKSHSKKQDIAKPFNEYRYN